VRGLRPRQWCELTSEQAPINWLRERCGAAALEANGLFGRVGCALGEGVCVFSVVCVVGVWWCVVFAGLCRVPWCQPP